MQCRGYNERREVMKERLKQLGVQFTLRNVLRGESRAQVGVALTYLKETGFFFPLHDCHY